MNRFHLTLPSNSSMSCYPNNTVAQFVTKLPQAIELDGDWEVALTEISFPIHMPNVLPDTCSITVMSSAVEPVRTYTLEWGYHKYNWTVDTRTEQTLTGTRYRAVSES